jgi:hypothetical protein
MYSGRDWPFIQVGEDPILSWDFTPDLAPGDTILSATVTCIEMNGLDDSPSDLLATAAEQQGNVILQPTMAFTVAGARYRFTFSASTSSRTVEWYSYIRVFAPGT